MLDDLALLRVKYDHLSGLIFHLGLGWDVREIGKVNDVFPAFGSRHPLTVIMRKLNTAERIVPGIEPPERSASGFAFVVISGIDSAIRARNNELGVLRLNAGMPLANQGSF